MLGSGPAPGVTSPRRDEAFSCTPSDFLTSLAPDQQAALQGLGVQRDYAAGQRVAQGGRPWPYVALVDQGELEAVKESSEGRALIPWILSRGDLFWGALAREDGILPVSLRARTPLVLTLWGRDDFLAVLEMHPLALRPLCREMASCMARAAEWIERLAFQPLRARLAHLLLATYQPTDGCRRRRFLTLDQMAERLGTTREVVCRLLHGFAKDGLLEATRSELRFHDVGALRAVAGQKVGSGPSPGTAREISSWRGS